MATYDHIELVPNGKDQESGQWRMPSIVEINGVNVVQIPITRGYVTFVDIDDYQIVSSHHWRANGNRREHVYVVSRKQVNKNIIDTCMHRLILGEPDGLVDHVNGDGLDNRRSNLRVCSDSQNSMNRRRRMHECYSRFKGVNLQKRCKQSKWQARIYVNKKRISLGGFRDEVEAAKAYDRAARMYFGEFACLNFPGD